MQIFGGMGTRSRPQDPPFPPLPTEWPPLDHELVQEASR